MVKTLHAFFMAFQMSSSFDRFIANVMNELTTSMAVELKEVSKVTRSTLFLGRKEIVVVFGYVKFYIIRFHFPQSDRSFSFMV